MSYRHNFLVVSAIFVGVMAFADSDLVSATSVTSLIELISKYA